MYKMLVVDDESWIRERLISTIDWAELGIEVIGEAEDGEEALNISKEKLPDIILTDIRMPCLDGLEFVKQLKESNIKSRVIVISGYSDFDYTQKAIRLGADDYILKPVVDEDLILAVQRCMDDIKAYNESQELLEAALNNNNSFLVNTEHLINNIKVKDRQGASLSLKFLFNQIHDREKKYSANLKLIYINLVTLVFRSVFEGKENIENLSILKQNLMDMMEKLKDEDELQVLLNNAVQNVISVLEKNDGGSKRKIVKKVEEYIRINDNQLLSLNDVAQVMYLNASYLSKIFREETGETFTKYLMKLRVEKAIELMNDPTLKIYEIAQIVGYEDIQYFSKMFKSITGVSPIKYREKIKP